MTELLQTIMASITLTSIAIFILIYLLNSAISKENRQLRVRLYEMYSLNDELLETIERLSNERNNN